MVDDGEVHRWLMEPVAQREPVDVRAIAYVYR
jgi:hypothetical protein